MLANFISNTSGLIQHYMPLLGKKVIHFVSSEPHDSVPKNVRNVAIDIQEAINSTTIYSAKMLKFKGGMCKKVVALLTMTSYFTEIYSANVKAETNHPMLKGKNDLKTEHYLSDYKEMMQHTTETLSVTLSAKAEAEDSDITHVNNHPYRYYSPQIQSTDHLHQVEEIMNEKYNVSVNDEIPSVYLTHQVYELRFANSKPSCDTSNSDMPFFITFTHRVRYDDIRREYGTQYSDREKVKFLYLNYHNVMSIARKDILLSSPVGVRFKDSFCYDVCGTFADNAIVYYLLGKTLMEFIADKIRNHPDKSSLTINHLIQLSDFTNIIESFMDDELRNVSGLESYLVEVLARVFNNQFPVVQFIDKKNLYSKIAIRLDSSRFKHIQTGSLYLKEEGDLYKRTLKQIESIGKVICLSDYSDPASYFFWSARVLTEKFIRLLNPHQDNIRSYYSYDIFPAMKKMSGQAEVTVYNQSALMKMVIFEEIITQLKQSNNLDILENPPRRKYLPKKQRIEDRNFISPNILLISGQPERPHFYDIFIKIEYEGNFFFLPAKHVGWDHDKRLYVFIEPETKEVIWDFIVVDN